MARKNVAPGIQADVVTLSKRRCALCFGINNDLSERPGQIAHLNKNNADARFENLAWLCIEHHDKFDSITRQTKNYTEIEVRRYRDELYRHFKANEYAPAELIGVRNYLTEYGPLFQYLFTQYDELAFAVHWKMMDAFGAMRDSWPTSHLRSFNSDIRSLQDRITARVYDLLGIYETNMYDLVGSNIKFDNKNFAHSVLVKKRAEARAHVDEISDCHEQLQAIAVSKT